MTIAIEHQLNRQVVNPDAVQDPDRADRGPQTGVDDEEIELAPTARGLASS